MDLSSLVHLCFLKIKQNVSASLLYSLSWCLSAQCTFMATAQEFVCVTALNLLAIMLRIWQGMGSSSCACKVRLVLSTVSLAGGDFSTF